MKEYKNFLKNMFQFDGRSRRREYWVVSFINANISILLNVILFLACTLVGDPLVYTMDTGYGGGMSTTGSLVGTIIMIPIVIWSVFVFVSTLGLTVRRFHDAGVPGWVYPICLVGSCCCGLGAIALLVITLLPSKEDNQYGVNPKAPENNQYEGAASIIMSIVMWVVLLFLYVVLIFTNISVCGLKSNPNGEFSDFGREIDVETEEYAEEIDTEEYIEDVDKEEDAYVVGATTAINVFVEGEK